MKFCISAFLKTSKYALEIEDFEPKDGYEIFLKNLCFNLGEKFIDWQQGVESGIGHITFKDYTLTIVWTDFPSSLSFDCRDEVMATELQSVIERYFENKSSSST